jgi:hypothetical protein
MSEKVCEVCREPIKEGDDWRIMQDETRSALNLTVDFEAEAEGWDLPAELCGR